MIKLLKKILGNPLHQCKMEPVKLNPRMWTIYPDGGYGFRLVPNEWSYKSSKDPDEPMYACWDCGAMERK